MRWVDVGLSCSSRPKMPVARVVFLCTLHTYTSRKGFTLESETRACISTPQTADSRSSYSSSPFVAIFSTRSGPVVLCLSTSAIHKSNGRIKYGDALNGRYSGRQAYFERLNQP
jgi:hypothetical protein